MATPFDATTKELVRFQPSDWLVLLGLPPAPCVLVDADLATVSTEADRLIRVETARPYLVHIEFQAGHDGYAVPGRMLRYNVLAGEQKELSVLSFVILLRPEADSPAITGQVERRRPDGTRYLAFEFGVIRLWQVPVGAILKGGLATLPLALLCDFSALTPQRVVAGMEARIREEAKSEDRRKLWVSTYLLAGVRFKQEVAGKLLEKAVAQMKESTTYQHILAEGRQEGELQGALREARNLLLRLGTRRMGVPDALVHERLEAIAEIAALEELADRLLVAESWQELLA